jgi:protein ImuB
MLWLCILLPQLALEAPAGGPPGVRQPRIEQAALRDLALWALQWSSQVSTRLASDGVGGGEAALWLEIGASQQLFGTHTALRERISTGLAPLGYTGWLGIAPTPQGAALLARAQRGERHGKIGGGSATTHAELQRQLQSLPLTLLALAPEHLAALASAGLESIGSVLELPPASLAQRFGPAASLYLQRLCGQAHEPLRMIRPPPGFASRCEFASPVTDTTALLFPLRRLLAGLQGYLRSLDRAVQRYTLQLDHHRRAATRLEIGLARPGREAAQLLALARERLAGTVLAAPVHGLRLEARELLQPLVLQLDCFSPAAQEAEQLQQVIDRLAARLGSAAVQTLHGAADHRPERAWQTLAAQGTAPPATATAGTLPARPCWLLPEPQRLAAPPQLLAGPERIESGWWDGGDIARDYYLARGADGAQLWVYHDLRGGSWHVHGLWA